MKYGRISIWYVLFDLAGSAVAWALFCLVRNKVEIVAGSGSAISSEVFISGLLAVPVSWSLLFLLTGFYTISFRRSRAEELAYSLAVTIPFVIILFFVLIMYNFITSSKLYFDLLKTLFLLLFTFTYIPRLVITSLTARKVHKGVLGYKTLLIGSNGLAHDIYKRINDEKIRSGNILAGYVSIKNGKSGMFDHKLDYLGNLKELPGIIAEHKIEQVIIAIEENEHNNIGSIIGKLEYRDVTIKAIPSLKDILTGRVEHTAIFGTPLLELSNRLMPEWQANIKQIFDYSFALIMLILSSPLILILSLLIYSSDKGPVIYSQKRIGKNGKPFTIYKFRSMHTSAETGSPVLSSKNDSRITPVGKFMRKHRLDEIPNLINVLKGEMSFVGPRPERQYFIDRIVETAPHYLRLMKVKPGITSWGQVKYGYASSVEEMIERLEFDLLYLENMTLLIDLKILIYTFFIILKGKGV